MAADLEKPEELWRIVPLAEYAAPSMPAQESMRKKLSQMLRHLRPSPTDTKEVNGELQTAPESVLERAAPTPTHQPFFSSLDPVVDEWLSLAEPRNYVMVVVVPPGQEFELMRRWAGEREAEIAPAPSREALLGGDFDTLPGLDGDRLLVIPDLERWFLRQHTGLTVVRELISRLSDTRRRCVIGVNSWAWSYLAQAADAAIELPSPLTIAPFDDAALCRWFSDLAESVSPGGVIFRRHDTGEILLDPAKCCTAAARPAEENGRNDFLKRLAALSRGNPWLAWHLFRNCLRVTPDRNGTSEKAEPGPGDRRRTIWINPAAEIVLPEFPKEVRSAALLILHALLLHGDLELEGLRRVLPPINTSHVLHRLANERILVEREARWRVAPTAYPAVREALSHVGFPIDPL